MNRTLTNLLLLVVALLPGCRMMAGVSTEAAAATEHTIVALQFPSTYDLGEYVRWEHLGEYELDWDPEYIADRSDPPDVAWRLKWRAREIAHSLHGNKCDLIIVGRARPPEARLHFDTPASRGPAVMFWQTVSLSFYRKGGSPTASATK